MSFPQSVKILPPTESLLDRRHFYIDGKWTDPSAANDFPVISPVTELPIATISLGTQADVDKAVTAAKRAFQSYAETCILERLRLLSRIVEVYQSRIELIAETISAEMGAPISLCRSAQVPAGLAHFSTMIKLLEHFKFE